MSIDNPIRFEAFDGTCRVVLEILGHVHMITTGDLIVDAANNSDDYLSRRSGRFYTNPIRPLGHDKRRAKEDGRL